MNRPFAFLIMLCVTPWLASCGVFIDAPEYFHSLAKRRSPPLPESEWNALGVWQRVADEPPTYIPKGYPITAPRGVEQGTWLVDQRDGKQLFVPRTKVRELEPGLMLGEARKITNPPPVSGIYRPGEF
jgi:hypothetical protein